MYYRVTILITIVQCGVLFAQLSEILELDKLPEDAILNFNGLATKYGHPPLEYTVVTEDNYILTLYRLPGKSKYPTLLMHGIYQSSEAFVMRGNNSLGITLANDGYDVWIGNFRGNRYSRRHVFLNPDSDPIYWKYSFDQMGYYDLPAIIDTILNETKASTLTAIAHSMGTTAFFVLCSTRTEYNAKINVMMALAPICYLHNTPPTTSNMIKLSPILEEVVNSLKITEILGDNSIIRSVLRTICTIPLLGYEICTVGSTFKTSGYDPAELEPSFSPIYNAHSPAGGSSMSALHFLQVGRRKIFAKYDYGIEKNQVIYNSSTPKPYELRNIVMPVALFTARNDRISSIADVALLRQQLPNVVYNLINPNRLCNHVDYIIGRRMNEYLFPYIYKILVQYNGFH